MAEFKRRYSGIRKMNTNVVALSVDTAGQSAALKKEMDLPFQLLCDPDRTVVNHYDLLNPHEHGGIAYPAIFIVNRNAVICYRSLDRTYSRVDLSEVMDFLTALSRNPNHRLQSASRKKLIVPSAGELLQIFRNMLFRGTRQDWKHYLFYILRPLKHLLGMK